MDVFSERKGCVGIDLSLDSTGLACKFETRTIKTGKIGDGTISEWAERIETVAEAVIDFVRCVNPLLIIIEEPNHFGNFKLGGRQTGNWHERAGLHWRVVCDLKRRGYTVATVRNATIRSVILAPKGAKKSECLRLAREAFPWKALCNDDEADAYALCVIGHEWIGDPIRCLPVSNREKIGKPPWILEEKKSKLSIVAKPRSKTSKPRKAKDSSMG